MRWLAVVATTLTLALAAPASVPETIGYQGVLRDGTGTPLPDATYTITFRLYDVPTGGTELWSESQGVATTGGIFDAVLGSVTPLTLPFDDEYWLGVQVESDPELTPRTVLTSTPYAMRAKYGELTLPYTGSASSSLDPVFHVENPDGPAILATTDLPVDGKGAIRADALNGQMYASLGYKSGGTTWGLFTPYPIFAHAIETGGDIVAHNADGYFDGVYVDDFQMQTAPSDGYVLTSDASGNGTWQQPAEFTLPYTGSASSSLDPVFHVENPDGPAILATTDLPVDGKGAIRADALNGQMYASLGYKSGGTTWGLFTPYPIFAHAIETGGDIVAHNADGYFDGVYVDDFHLQTAPSDGYVLTSDASGNGTWQPPTAGSDGDWTVAGDDMYSGNTGSVGIGTTTPERKLHVRDSVAGGVSYALKLDNPENDAGSAVGVLFKIDSGTESRGKGGLVYERTDTWNRGSFHFLQDNGVSYANPDLADAVMTIDNSGNVGIGTTTPSEPLQVAGVVHSTSGGFRFPDGTVQTSTATGGLVLPYSGSTTTADEVLAVSNNGTGTAIQGTHASSGNYGYLGGPIHAVRGECSVNSGAGVYGKHNGTGVAVYANAPSGIGLEATSGTGPGVWASSSSGDAVSAITYNGRALYAEDADGKTAVLCDADYGVQASNTAGTEGYIAGGQYGVYGETSVNNGAGVYGKHNGSGVAVYANAPSGVGVEASSGSGSGVWATSSTGNAVHAISVTGYAGYFEGGIRTDGFEYPTGASDGYALISDASGIAGWQRLGPSGLADPMDFGSQTWDWDFTGGKLDMDITAGYPVLDLTNSSASGYGGVALIRSTSTTVNSAGTRALRVTTQRGNAGSFQKYISDGYSTVDIFADSSTGLGLYVSGTITSTAKSARGVETVRGTEPVFAAETVEPEIYDSGEAFLSGGRASVTFDQLFTDAVSKEARVRVTVTPIGGWSALYLESTGSEGFVVRSADGDPNIEFFWTACGLCRDHEAARQITFPDHEEIERIEREQGETIGS